jgi:hypothetical protein
MLFGRMRVIASTTSIFRVCSNRYNISIAGGSRTNLSALHVFNFFQQGIAPILRKQLPKHVNSGMQLIYNAAIGILPAKLVPLCERHSSSMWKLLGWHLMLRTAATSCSARREVFAQVPKTVATAVVGAK